MRTIIHVMFKATICEQNIGDNFNACVARPIRTLVFHFLGGLCCWFLNEIKMLLFVEMG